MSIIMYHNPSCSKSRKTLAILKQQNINPQIIEYLKTPPDVATLKQLLSCLNISARQLLRQGEKAYQEAELNNPDLSEDELITAMTERPILIERPIVINNGKAIIGRPPENVLSIL